MTTRCFHCGGKGHVAVDCPICRGSDSFEHDNLTPGKCLGCHDSGLIEEPCPECGGRGVVAGGGQAAS